MKSWNLILVAALILVAFLANANEPINSPYTRAKLMMECDPELAAQEIAITTLVGQSVMMEADHAEEYNEAIYRYREMKSCKDVENSYEEFVAIAKKYGNDPAKYWLTEEGRKTLENSAEYLKQTISID